MRKIVFVILCFLPLFNSAFAQGMQAAPADKALVYFLRPSGFGGLINFSFFDSAQVIGRFNGEKYMVYECTPGPHVFWARSENRSYISGNFEAGKIYFIEAVPQLGGIKAGVELVQTDPADAKKMAKLMKFIGKHKPRSFTQDEIAELSKDLDDVLRRGMDDLQTMRSNGNAIPTIDNSKHITLPPPVGS
ncbi:MAG TPA: hypothetical protein VLC98_08120 [Phnomibacter sp.]|nr:hypothetical protein [Phnomibacter sp.]